MKNRLRILRAEKEVTQADLADIIGVSRQTVNAMEKAKYVPSTVLALKLAAYFKVQVTNIFQLEESD